MTTTSDPDLLSRAWSVRPGIVGWLTAVNHKRIGMRFIVTALVFFMIGGVMALLMRTQLIVPENDFLGAELYNQLFTMHGTTMMFLFAVPILEGLGIYFLPLMLGTRDLPFPRLNAFGYWMYLFGGLVLFSSFLAGQVPAEGWFAYVPLSSVFTPDRGMDFWLFGVSLVEISGIVGALELVVGFLRNRATGMSLDRVPLFVWGMVVAAAMMVVAFPTIVAGSTLLELERATALVFFEPAAGGDPLLWQHLFWFFGHPEVYIMVLPALGAVSMIVPVAAGRPMAGRGWAVASLVAIGVASFSLWVHHMFTVGLPAVALAFFSAASMLIAIPSGVLIFAWLGTLWGGRTRPRLSVPLLFVIGFVVIFVIGGITGVMVAAVPFNLAVHDTYFIVAHFHYVLIGGVVFPLFAGIHHWFPKWSGRLASERSGRAAFWAMFVGTNLAFFPQHLLGFQGMPRRVFTYDVGLGWELGNLLSTIGGVILAAGVVTAIVDLVVAARRGPLAGANPWNADSLEWATASPPPVYNFRELPVVDSPEPLWNGSDPTAPGRRPDWVERLTEPDEAVREVVETDPIDATPRRVARLAGDSPWPLATAASITAAAVGLLAESSIVAVLAIGAIVACLVGWGLDGPQVWGRDERDVRSHTTVWGLTVALVSVSVVVCSMLFAYWYLAGQADAWPPEGAAPIPLGWAAVAAVAAVVMVVGSRAARITEPTVPTVVGGLGVAAVAALVTIGALVGMIDRVGPMAGSAYTSIVSVLLGSVGALAVAVVLVAVIAAMRAAHGHGAGGVMIRVTGLLGGYTLVALAAVLATVFLGGIT